MTEKREQDLPFHLRGNYAPVTEERTVVDLAVEGTIPPELRGVYMRNGPNPKSGYSSHWFVGDGMLHGVRLENGRAQWYRNRYVRTRTLTEGVEFVDANGNVDHSAGVNNTNIVQHAGQVLALVESSFPVEVTRELETVGAVRLRRPAHHELHRASEAVSASPASCTSSATGSCRRG